MSMLKRLSLKIVFLFFILNIFINISYAATEITYLPYIISTPGDYFLSSDLSSVGNGVQIGTDNVNLECNNYKMTGPNSGSFRGISAPYTGSVAKDNINISNCFLTDFFWGVYLKGDNYKITNLNITNTDYAADLGTVTNSNFENYTAYNNTRGGRLITSSTNNNFKNILVYNNTYGFQVTSSHNNFENVDFYDNSDYDLDFSSSINNSFDFLNFSDRYIEANFPQNLGSYEAIMSECVGTSGLTYPGITFEIKSDIYQSPSTNYCFYFYQDNITLDCNNYTMSGDSLSQYSISSNGKNNIKVNNCNIDGFKYGLSFSSCENIHVSNISIYNSSLYGLYSACYNSTFDNFEISNVDGPGVYIQGGSGKNTYDSFFIHDNTDSGLIVNTIGNSFNDFYIENNSNGVEVSIGGDASHFNNFEVINNTNTGFEIKLGSIGQTLNNIFIKDNPKNGMAVYSENNYFGNNISFENNGYSATSYYDLRFETKDNNTIEFLNFSKDSIISKANQNVLNYYAELDSCQELAFPGITFNLKDNVIQNENANCFEVSENNISLNCENYKIIGNKSYSRYGVYVSGSGTDYFSISNCEIYDFSYGIRNLHTANSYYENLLLHDNSARGISFESNADYFELFNVSLYNHTSEDFSASSINGVVWGSHFASTSDIRCTTVNNFSRTNPSVGNYYDDFVCLNTTSLIYDDFNYTICTNPSSIALTGTCSDLAPLASVPIYIGPSIEESSSGSSSSVSTGNFVFPFGNLWTELLVISLVFLGIIFN